MSTVNNDPLIKSTVPNTPDLLPANIPKTVEDVYIEKGMAKKFSPVHPLDASGFQGVLTIDMILKLVTQTVKSLQNVAVANANRLNFMVKWQTAYTNQMSQIHAFTKNHDSTSISGSTNTGVDSKMSANRDDMNRVNANYTETMRAYRSVISDQAKQIQTYLQQLNDSVSQQASMFTTLMQQQSSILSSMYR